MSSQNILCSSYLLSSSNKNNNKLKSLSQKENIINWLFQMDYQERVKTCSLVNRDICHAIIKMYDKFSISSKTKFKLNLKDKKPILNQTDVSEDLPDNYKCNQKIFLKEVRFYKIHQTNDAITLSSKILDNKKVFSLIFDELSRQNFLTEICPVIFDQKQGVYTCTSPKWIEEKEYYTISEIIIGYFENILNIKYILSKKKKNDINDVFNNFFNKRNLILDLIKNSTYKENLYDIIDLKNIITEALNNKTLVNDEERRLASKKFLCGLYNSFKMFEPPVDYNINSYFYKYKEMLMEKSVELLDNLIFFGFEGQNTIDLYIKERIVEELYAYADKKRVENILLEIQKDGFLTNTKKKQKKKKKKNKKNENNEENKEKNDKVNNNEINNNTNDINNNNIENNNSYYNSINNMINMQENEDIKEKIIKIKEDNNENNTSTISNSSYNNNKDNTINNNENIDIKNDITNEIELEHNNNLENINDDPDKNNIQNKNIFIDKKDSSDSNKVSEIEDNNIKAINELSNEDDSKKEEEKEIENNIENNINNNNIIINPNHKKKRKKKTKKKNYKLTQQELNNIYTNFYNENNNFKDLQNKKSNTISPIKISNKNSFKDKNEQLHNLILSFEKKIYKKILSLHEIKYNSIVLLCQKIKEHFKCELSIFIYGSYSTGLELEESDIDISVELLPNKNNGKINNNINQKTIPELINELNEYLLNFPEFKNLFPIVNTKIPILKMKIVQDNNIETKIDLTFNLKNTKTTINYYNNTLKRYPQIKPITLLIKYLVKKNKLGSVFEGGFSSHSLFIMVASNIRVLLKNKSSLNLGDLLNGFLHFFGKIFNYTNTTIDLMNKNNPYIIMQDFSNVPVFIDPITKLNVSKSSYMHEELKKLFNDTYDRLVQGEDNLNKTFEDIFSDI